MFVFIFEVWSSKMVSLSSQVSMNFIKWLELLDEMFVARLNMQCGHKNVNNPY